MKAIDRGQIASSLRSPRANADREWNPARLQWIIRAFLSAGIFALGFAGPTRAEAADPLSEAQGLIQMGYPNRAFALLVDAAANNPSNAQRFRSVAQEALDNSLDSAESLRRREANDEALDVLKPIWTGLVNPAAENLFGSRSEVKDQIDRVYLLLNDITLRIAQNRMAQGDLEEALRYANYSTEYRGGELNFDARWMKADLLLRLDRADEAMQTLGEIASVLNPRDPRQAQVQSLMQNIEKNTGVEMAKVRHSSVSESTEARLISTILDRDDWGFSIDDRDENYPHVRVGGRYVLGLSYPNLPLSRFTRIRSARIQFILREVPEWSKAPPFRTYISAQDVGNAAPILKKKPGYAVHLRKRVMGEVEWTIEKPVAGRKYVTPDFGSVVQAVIDRSDWAPGNRMTVVFFGGNGPVDFQKPEDSKLESCRLLIDYEIVMPPNPGVLKHVTLNLADPADDGFCAGPNSRNSKTFRAGRINKGAVSFRDFPVPRGGVIESAHLVGEFQSMVGNFKPPWVSFVRCEVGDNLSQVGENDLSIHNRDETRGAVTWLLANPAQNAQVRSPDLAPLVQLIVNQRNWSSGNRMNFIISGGDGVAEFGSMDDAAEPFRLELAYYE